MAGGVYRKIKKGKKKLCKLFFGRKKSGTNQQQSQQEQQERRRRQQRELEQEGQLMMTKSMTSKIFPMDLKGNNGMEKAYFQNNDYSSSNGTATTLSCSSSLRQQQVDALQRKLILLEKDTTTHQHGNNHNHHMNGFQISDIKNLLYSIEQMKEMYGPTTPATRTTTTTTDGDAMTIFLQTIEKSIDNERDFLFSIQENEKKIVQLQNENKELRNELENEKVQRGIAIDNAKNEAVAAMTAKSILDEEKMNGTISLLKHDVTNLNNQLTEKVAEVEQLRREKNRLESYTKRTLNKFQDKYLNELQECKAKLREKQEKIRALEKRQRVHR